ncbi:LysR family transcriptional regulator ArgP [Vibrio gallicus]|uniref:LysR family transcriptional regulator ArgP n=1 Tax=Vibrio gallicus TaxID=190897 RepID=UPI0021C4331B|nr:LysR family transcriptional regulator ArgP [Vibrio gallicus]
MKGLDYRWIETLDAVIKSGSFERAAELLFISQSAVSQRIKQLESWANGPVLIRESPLKVTAMGKKLLGLYRQVKLLEDEIFPQLPDKQQVFPLAIATNADTVATWLIPALKSFIAQHNVELNLIVDDERRTVNKLKNGEVVGAISSVARPLPSCETLFLGQMKYVCVATPSFIERYFSHGKLSELIHSAPEIAFEPYDVMNENFVASQFGESRGVNIKHSVRSSEACVSMTLASLGYCVLPELQIKEHIASGALIDLAPGEFESNALYWHYWPTSKGVLAHLTSALKTHAKGNLYQQL